MSQVKERPILFSAPMVRAILECRKTVTRRPVKGAASKWLIDFTPEFVADRANDLCPHGKPGDRLWVRETHADIGCRLTYRADLDDGGHCKVAKWTPAIHMFRKHSRILLEITDVRVERLQDITEEQAVAEGLIWQGQESGKAFYSHAERKYPPGAHQQFGISGVDAVSAFRNLWNSVGGDWDANPWVWVVEFKRVKP